MFVAGVTVTPEHCGAGGAGGAGGGGCVFAVVVGAAVVVVTIETGLANRVVVVTLFVVVVTFLVVVVAFLVAGVRLVALDEGLRRNEIAARLRAFRFADATGMPAARTKVTATATTAVPTTRRRV